MTDFLWVLGAVIVLALMTLADSITDKRHSAKAYPEWHALYAKFKPHWLWEKLQNRWHVWKQSRYFSPASYIWLGASCRVWEALGMTAGIVFGACVAIGVLCLWAMVEPPDWWHRKPRDNIS